MVSQWKFDVLLTLPTTPASYVSWLPDSITILHCFHSCSSLTWLISHGRPYLESKHMLLQGFCQNDLLQQSPCSCQIWKKKETQTETGGYIFRLLHHDWLLPCQAHATHLPCCVLISYSPLGIVDRLTTHDKHKGRKEKYLNKWHISENNQNHTQLEPRSFTQQNGTNPKQDSIVGEDLVNLKSLLQ